MKVGGLLPSLLSKPNGFGMTDTLTFEQITRLNGEVIDSWERVIELPQEIPPEQPPVYLDMKVNTATLNIRTEPSVKGGEATRVRTLVRNNVVSVRKDWLLEASPETDNITWRQLKPENEQVYYCAEKNTSGTIYLVTLAEPVDPQPTPSDYPYAVQGKWALVQDSAGHTYIGGLTKSRLFGANIYCAPVSWDRPNVEGCAIPRYATYFDEARPWGNKVWRLFCASNDMGEHLYDCIDQILDAMAVYGQYAVLCLTNTGWSHGRQTFLAHDQNFLTCDGKLSPEWFINKEYEHAYIPHLHKMVTRFKDHPSALMWELGNEFQAPKDNALATPQCSNAIIDFFNRASKAIYDLDKQHPISLGISSSAECSPASVRDGGVLERGWAFDFYARLPYVHVVSNHIYPIDQKEDPRYNDVNAEWTNEYRIRNDGEVAKTRKMVHKVGEYGSHRHLNRLVQTQKLVDRNPDVSLWLHWAYMQEPQDVGIGGYNGLDTLLDPQPDKLLWWVKLLDYFKGFNL